MEFNKILAIYLAGLSGKSYVQLTFKKNNNGFLLEESPTGEQYLAFPGSEQIQDWVEDAEFIKVYRNGLGWIHNGFADTWDELKEVVVEKVDKNKPLYITGHSLGGADACVAALSLKNNGYNVKQVYTFGQPRVGNKEWYNNFTNAKIELFRVKNGKDIVTTLPKFFYWHVGKEIQINPQPFFTWFHDSFLEHKLGNYEEALKKL